MTFSLTEPKRIVNRNEMHKHKARKIQRKSDSELPEDLRPLNDEDVPDLPRGSDEINERFVAFGGNPVELNDAASIASAGLVIAEQIAQLTSAVHVLTFLLAPNEDSN